MLLSRVRSLIPIQLKCKQGYQHQGQSCTQPQRKRAAAPGVFHHSSPHISLYVSSLPFFSAPHYYFHHLCLSRYYANHYNLISFKWSRLQTWALRLCFRQSAFTNLHTNIALAALGIDCHEVKTVTWADTDPKKHTLLLKTSIKLIPAYIENEGQVILFSFQRCLLHLMHCPKLMSPPACMSSWLKRNLSSDSSPQDKDLLHSYPVYKRRVPNSTASLS